MTEILTSTPQLAGPTQALPKRELPQKITEFTEEFKGVWSVLGPLGTARYFHRKRSHLDYPVELRHSSLDHPIDITSALCDVLNVKEVLNDGAYGLGSLKPEIDGLPIIDIGAFIGISTVFFASKYPNSKVHAIEPLDRNYKMLEQNTSAYGDQIATSQAAVLEKSGNASVVGGTRRHPYMPLFAAQTLGSEDNAELGVPVVPPLSLLDLCGVSDEIGILKIDIEGGEAGLFGSGAIDPVLERTRVLMIETHDQFVPGCRDAVDQATSANGLTLASQNRHAISVYVKP